MKLVIYMCYVLAGGGQVCHTHWHYKPGFTSFARCARAVEPFVEAKKRQAWRNTRARGYLRNYKCLSIAQLRRR